MRHDQGAARPMAATKKLWIGICVLALLSPLGLILPALFGAGGAWGEWGLEQIEKLAGQVPEGMKKLSHIWQAPMSDYAVPGQGQSLVHKSLGYLAAAIIGIALTAGLAYLLARAFSRKKSR